MDRNDEILKEPREGSVGELPGGYPNGKELELNATSSEFSKIPFLSSLGVAGNSTLNQLDGIYKDLRALVSGESWTQLSDNLRVQGMYYLNKLTGSMLTYNSNRKVSGAISTAKRITSVGGLIDEVANYLTMAKDGIGETDEDLLEKVYDQRERGIIYSKPKIITDNPSKSWEDDAIGIHENENPPLTKTVYDIEPLDLPFVFKDYEKCIKNLTGRSDGYWDITIYPYKIDDKIGCGLPMMPIFNDSSLMPDTIVDSIDDYKNEGYWLPIIDWGFDLGKSTSTNIDYGMGSIDLPYNYSMSNEFNIDILDNEYALWFNYFNKVMELMVNKTSNECLPYKRALFCIDLIIYNPPADLPNHISKMDTRIRKKFLVVYKSHSYGFDAEEPASTPFKIIKLGFSIVGEIGDKTKFNNSWIGSEV